MATFWQSRPFEAVKIPSQDRRTLQNKSGEIYFQLVVNKVEKVEKLKSGEISGPKWRNLYLGYEDFGFNTI